MITCNVCGGAPQSLNEAWVYTEFLHYHYDCAVPSNREYQYDVQSWIGENQDYHDEDLTLDDFIFHSQWTLELTIDHLDPESEEYKRIAKEEREERYQANIDFERSRL